jgi:hypothetical protein
MAARKTEFVIDPKKPTVVMKRVFDAPRHRCHRRRRDEHEPPGGGHRRPAVTEVIPSLRANQASILAKISSRFSSLKFS